ncbi:MAG: sulfotransferase family protein [Solirubrobacteraceae bacterium]
MKEELDFIVIGAQKAGTTSLFEYLRRHPEIGLPASKEAPYFSHDAVYELGWRDFMSKAAFVDETRKWGTVTPHYMVGGVYEPAAANGVNGDRYDERTIPLRIREQLPNVRIVAILRDPVERARSHYNMAVMNGFEQRSFDDAIGELLDPQMLARARETPEETTGYVTWGEYGRILAGYRDVFPADQILVVFTDELENAPELLLRRVHEFIGVASDFLPDNIGTRYRAGGTERRISWMSPYRSTSPQGLQRFLTRNSTARALWHRLPTAGRLRLKRGFEHFGYRVDLWNRRGSKQENGSSPAIVDRLDDHFASETEQLTTLFGVVPPWSVRGSS